MIVPLVRISIILDPHFGGVKTQKLPQMGHFVDTASVRKTLKNFNLAILNATLMKLTTIMYLHDIVNRKALRARNSDIWLNFLIFRLH